MHAPKMPKKGVNLSLLNGVPASRETGIEQHHKLAEMLRKREFYYFPFQNKGTLVLYEVPSGKYEGAYFNKLFSKAPKTKGIMETKV